MHNSDATTCLRCSLSSCFPCLYNRASDNAFFLFSFFSLFYLFIYILKLLSTLSLCLCLVIQGTSGHSECADLWGHTDTSLPASMPSLQQHQTGTDSSSTNMSLSEGDSFLFTVWRSLKATSYLEYLPTVGKKNPSELQQACFCNSSDAQPWAEF